MRYSHDYYGFVYFWRDSKHNRFYIGSHYGKTNDTYIASSKWLKAAYKKRPADFKRRVIQYLTTPDKKLLHSMEQRYLDMIKDHELSTSQNVIAGTNRYYNMKRHASGGNGSANKGQTRNVWNKGLTKDDPRVAANALKISKAKTGRPHSAEHKRALSEAVKATKARNKIARSVTTPGPCAA